MLDQLLGGSKDALIGKLAGQLGLGQPQAGGFLQQALGLLQGALNGGKLDIAGLLGGNPSALTQGLDISTLAGLVGGDATKATGGLNTIVGELISGIKANPSVAEKLLSQAVGGGGGGLGGALGGLAGKLFGKG